MGFSSGGRALKHPLVGVVMGSDSDWPVMEETCKILAEFDVPHDVLVASAHRSQEWTRKSVGKWEKNGVKVVIAGAGGAAHLAGVIAAESILPVIGVPIEATSLQGLDSLLSTVQMPGGTPVATMAIGKAGARNAGILAVQILALNDKKLTTKLETFKKERSEAVKKKSRELRSRYVGNG